VIEDPFEKGDLQGSGEERGLRKVKFGGRRIRRRRQEATKISLDRKDVTNTSAGREIKKNEGSATGLRVKKQEKSGKKGTPWHPEAESIGGTTIWEKGQLFERRRTDKREGNHGVRNSGDKELRHHSVFLAKEQRGRERQNRKKRGKDRAGGKKKGSSGAPSREAKKSKN